MDKSFYTVVNIKETVVYVGAIRYKNSKQTLKQKRLQNLQSLYF
jgi:hypothetical protein